MKPAAGLARLGSLGWAHSWGRFDMIRSTFALNDSILYLLYYPSHTPPLRLFLVSKLSLASKRNSGRNGAWRQAVAKRERNGIKVTSIMLERPVRR